MKRHRSDAYRRGSRLPCLSQRQCQWQRQVQLQLQELSTLRSETGSRRTGRARRNATRGFNGRGGVEGLVLPRVLGGGSWVGWLVRFVCTAPPTPTRNPPWRGMRFALPCRRIRAGLRPSGSRCRLLFGKVVVHVSVCRGAAERDAGVRRRVSDNRQDSNHPRLARAPRGALRGPRPQAPPATFARRPVR